MAHRRHGILEVGKDMTPGTDSLLRDAFVSVQVNKDFTQGILLLKDLSRLFFCHRVGERWVNAVGESREPSATTLAAGVLQEIAMFRLNAKHLEITFNDGSSWEFSFRNGAK